MSTIISFVNQKGGVGKTTSVVNIGAALSKAEQLVKKKKKVLVIDMDPQGNSSQVFSNITDDDPSIYDLLMSYSENIKSSVIDSELKWQIHIILGNLIGLYSGPLDS